MTNPILNNNIENTSVILWQYDKAWNLISLIESWNKFARESCKYFWDKFWGNNETFENGTFFIDQADTFGLNIWGQMLGIPRPVVNGKNVANDDVINDAISDDLYRRVLKARFFMMTHKPTVPNYNKFLSILWGAIDNTKVPSTVEHDMTKVFDADGNVALIGHYGSRSKAFDFLDMTMGFSFPLNANLEEALLACQHYDLIYPFPAGIRYPGAFVIEDKVIGLNVAKANGQMYKNFVDGIVMVDDNVGNPNGGIFSTTGQANYTEPTKSYGRAYIFDVSENVGAQHPVSFKVSSPTFPIIVWVDWGDGHAEYKKLFQPSLLLHEYDISLKNEMVGLRVVTNYTGVTFGTFSVNTVTKLDLNVAG